MAVVTEPDGAALESDVIRITIAPPVQPDTGTTLTAADPAETGRALMALLALLLVAGGFCLFFAGRLLVMLARDRLRTG